jgi:hypothetical protein
MTQAVKHLVIVNPEIYDRSDSPLRVGYYLCDAVNISFNGVVTMTGVERLRSLTTGAKTAAEHVIQQTSFTNNPYYYFRPTGQKVDVVNLVGMPVATFTFTYEDEE